MEIQETELTDLEAVTDLVSRVAGANILPHFSKQGSAFFQSKVLPDLQTTFDRTRFRSAKITTKGKLIAFGAIRDKDYITHMFVDTSYQGYGLGRALLDHLLATAIGAEVNLRASVNAVEFYQNHGFVATDRELENNGIRFVPMTLSLSSRD